METLVQRTNPKVFVFTKKETPEGGIRIRCIFLYINRKPPLSNLAYEDDSTWYI